jgi:predicted outer membrane repeat protein
MRLFHLAAVFLALSSLALTSTYYVPDDYPTIQDAINSSNHYDTIIVRPGTYVENLDFCGMLITVMSEKGPEVTIIDGGNPVNPDHGSVALFGCWETHDSVLDGFTLTNGCGSLFGDGYWGGGINIFNGASPTIRNNIITQNSVDKSGGGIHAWDSDAIITNNIISYNTAKGAAGVETIGGTVTFSGNVVNDNSCTNSTGGVRLSGGAGTFSNNTITYNSAPDYCGGVTVRGSDNVWIVESNFIAYNSSGIGGGGIYCKNNCSPLITNNVICANTSDEGGGIACYENASPLFSNNIIFANSAKTGGGIDCYDNASPTITNNTVCGNSASVKGGGIACRENSNATVSNTILWDNDAPKGSEIWIGPEANPSIVTISHSDVKGGQSAVDVKTGSTLNWGAGMIDADPLFAGSADDDFHLTFNSPCRDAGDSAASGLPDEDFECDPRVAQAYPDMGADEFHTHLYHLGDVVPGNPISVRVIGTPNEPATLILGSGIYDPPMPTPCGDLYLDFPLRFFDIGPVDSNGVCIINSKVPGVWNPGDEKPLQALVGPLGNPNSVLTNLMVLAVE